LGKKIAMISALGGQGCTLTAAYVGQAMTDVGRNVAMLDMCGFGGTLAYVLGAAENSGFNAGDVFNGRCSQDEALVDCGTGLSVIASSAFSDETILPYGVEARRIVESLSREGDVIADMPSGTVPDCGAVRCFDMFVICARADDLSLKYAAAMRRLIENSAADCGCNCDVRLVLTQFSSEYLRISRVNDIDVCIDTVGARLLGIVPHDVTAAKAAMSGQALDTACEAMNYCRDIACRICGEKIPLDSKPSLFKKSLF
jgi:septum formation inhibitor-activating ATPase MinD